MCPTTDPCRQHYRHIVLAVHDAATASWGALGISRRRELAYKPLDCPGLPALVAAFAQGYALWGHEVVKVRVGLPAPHDPGFSGRVCWRWVAGWRADAWAPRVGSGWAAAIWRAHRSAEPGSE